jgi:dCMP deaminase
MNDICLDNYASEDKWNLRFLFLAKHVASWSKDPSTRVGSVIFDSDHRVVSLGYNGLPSGLNDLHLQDRERKYQTIIHAEINAILFANRDLKDCTIATWPFMPCSNCSSAIIQTGIKRCIFPKAYGDRAIRWADSFLLAQEQFDEASVTMKEYDLPELLDFA